MSKSDAEAIVLETGENPDAAIIWLHGLGADGHDFVPIVKELALEPLRIRFVFPHARKIPVTINNGFVMRAWYDIESPNLLDLQDEKGMRESIAEVNRYIDAQIQAGIDSQRIIVAGFSQGGVIALLTAMRYEKPLAGIIALSTYLALADKAQAETAEANRKLPIFMGHGKHDPIVAYASGKKSSQLLQELSHPLEWHEYHMEHSVDSDEIEHISAWIHAKLGA